MHRRVRRKKADSDYEVAGLQRVPAETAEVPQVLTRGGHDFRRLNPDRDTEKPGVSASVAREDAPVPVRLQRAADGEIQVVARDPDPTTAPPGTTAAPATTAAPGTATADATPEEFLKHAAFGPELVTPGSGAFDATYTPTTGTLDIKMRGNINFTDGLTQSGGTITAATGDLTQAATDGNTLPADKQAAFVKQFQWDDAARTAFQTAFESKIESAWGGQFAFHCTRPGWDKVTAKVAVDVDVRAGAAAAKDHLGVTSYKVPDSGQYQVGNFVGGPGASAGYNPMTVDSTSTKPNPASMALLKRQVFFANNSAELSADALNTLKQFSIDFQTNNIPASNPVILEGHASAVGTSDYNLTLSEKRTAAVRAELVRLGFNGIDERTTEIDVGEMGADDAYAAWVPPCRTPGRQRRKPGAGRP